MKTLRLFLMATVLTAITGTSALAQNRNPGPPEDEAWSDPAQGGGGRTSVRREEVRKKIEAIRIWRLTDELKLDATTSTKMASILSAMDQQRRDLRRKQMQQIRELRSQLKSGKPDDTKLKAAIEQLEQDHMAVQQNRMKELSSLKDILTPEQQARYILFQLEFMREMRGMIHGTRTGERGTGRFSRGKTDTGASAVDPAANK